MNALTQPDEPQPGRDALQHAADDPAALERLYRQDPARFTAAFPALLDSQPQSPLLQAWAARLDFEEPDAAPASHAREIAVIAVLALVAGTYARLPAFFGGIEEDPFTLRNASLFVFPFIALYFAWKNPLPRKTLLLLGAFFSGALVYMNLLPYPERSDTIVLAALHLPVVLWLLAGVAYVGGLGLSAWTEYIRRSAEAVVYTALVLISGGVLTGVTVALFNVVGMDIVEWYMNYFGVYGAVAAPLVATAIVYHLPRTRLAPMLARMFTPLALATLVIYLIVIAALGKSPYTDRDFLLAFNLMLAGVLALVTLSIAGRPAPRGRAFALYVNTGLVSVGLVLNLIALSAILARLASYGFTPNRTAVLAANVLIFIHLAFILFHYVRALRGRADLHALEAFTVRYLLVYGIWAAFVVLLFPVLYGFA